MLSFAESYDPLWVAYDKNKSIKVNSIPLYSVINGFYINKTGNYELTIEYTPQRYFYVGSIISITTLILLLGYLIYDHLKNRPKKQKPAAPTTEDHPYHSSIKKLFLQNKLTYNETEEYLLKSYNKKETYMILKDWRLEKEHTEKEKKQEPLDMSS